MGDGRTPTVQTTIGRREQKRHNLRVCLSWLRPTCNIVTRPPVAMAARQKQRVRTKMLLEHLYESPVFSPTNTLAVTGWQERNLPSAIQRGHFPRASRPGRGTRRGPSLWRSITLRAFCDLPSEAQCPVTASIKPTGAGFFPSVKALLPALIGDVIRTCDQPGYAPRVFVILRDGHEPRIARSSESVIHQWATIMTDGTDCQDCCCSVDYIGATFGGITAKNPGGANRRNRAHELHRAGISSSGTVQDGLRCCAAAQPVFLGREEDEI